MVVKVIIIIVQRHLRQSLPVQLIIVVRVVVVEVTGIRIQDLYRGVRSFVVSGERVSIERKILIVVIFVIIVVSWNIFMIRMTRIGLSMWYIGGQTFFIFIISWSLHRKILQIII